MGRKDRIFFVIAILLFTSTAYATNYQMRFNPQTGRGDWIVADSSLYPSNAAYGVSWDGDIYTAPSKNAIYDKIESLGTFDTTGITSTTSSFKLETADGSSAVLDQNGWHIQTLKGLYLGTTRWDDGSDKIDGEQVADDTIDDDSIDFGTGADQVSGIDIPLNVTNFDGILGGTDTNIQAALETIDDYSAGSGDMTKAVYDTDTNDVVDSVDAVLASAINWDGYVGDIEAGTLSLALTEGYSSSAKFYEDPANGDNFVMFKAPASLAESSTAYVDDLNKHHATVTILEPADGDSANIYQWPAATKITGFACIVAGEGMSVPYTLKECTNPITCTTVKAVTCGSGGVCVTTDGSLNGEAGKCIAGFDDDSIASGSSLFIFGGAPTGSPTAAFINADFKVVR